MDAIIVIAFIIYGLVLLYTLAVLLITLVS